MTKNTFSALITKGEFEELKEGESVQILVFDAQNNTEIVNLKLSLTCFPNEDTVGE